MTVIKVKILVCLTYIKDGIYFRVWTVFGFWLRIPSHFVERFASHHPRGLDDQHFAVLVQFKIRVCEFVHPLTVVAHTILWLSPNHRIGEKQSNTQNGCLRSRWDDFSKLQPALLYAPDT